MVLFSRRGWDEWIAEYSQSHRMLTRAVEDVELGWHPVLDDPAEAEGFAGRGIRVRF